MNDKELADLERQLSIMRDYLDLAPDALAPFISICREYQDIIQRLIRALKAKQ